MRATCFNLDQSGVCVLGFVYSEAMEECVDFRNTASNAWGNPTPRAPRVVPVSVVRLVADESGEDTGTRIGLLGCADGAVE